jgi:hypothetical protein
MSNVTAAFNPKEPDGAYTLNMANPGHYQVRSITKVDGDCQLGIAMLQRSHA